jgi:hypothetical protein
MSPVGGTAMFDDKGLVGVTAGFASEFGLSGSYAQTGAWSLNDFGAKLGASIFDRFHKNQNDSNRCH